jgi:hypothetical protein
MAGRRRAALTTRGVRGEGCMTRRALFGSLGSESSVQLAPTLLPCAHLEQAPSGCPLLSMACMRASSDLGFGGPISPGSSSSAQCSRP